MYHGDLTDIQISAANVWAPLVRGVAYGSTYIEKFDVSNNYLAIVDTGSTLIHLPNKFYKILIKMWTDQLEDEFFGKGSHGLYHTKANCYHIKPMLSNFSIVLENRVFEISPESYLLDCEDLPGSVCQSKSECLFGVDSMDAEMGAFTQKIFILGETFVKNYYTVFDDTPGYPKIHMAVNKYFRNQA